MASIDFQTLSQLIRHLTAKLPGLIAIYLFGSAGRGQLRPDSDVDIGFLCDASQRKLEELELWELRAELEGIAHRDVDVIDCSQADPVLRAEIMLHGVRVFSSNDTKALEAEILSQRLREDFGISMRPVLEDVFTSGQAAGGTEPGQPRGNRPT